MQRRHQQCTHAAATKRSADEHLSVTVREVTADECRA